MATPLRLVELQCPRCGGGHWELDNDYRGADLFGGRELSYPERTYTCPVCGTSGTNYSVLQKGPSEFFLQPAPLYPMSVADFEHWVSILRANFPNNHLLGELGKTFFPYTPADRAAWERENPVAEMRDQDGDHQANPDLTNATEWFEVMRPGDSLSFLRRDRGNLQVDEGTAGTFSVRCTDARGKVAVEKAGLDSRTVLAAIRLYLTGDVAECVRKIDQPGPEAL